MANPYGIEQVDIPALLGMHQQMKRQRITDLMAAKEFELKQKEADRQDRKDAVLARIFMKGGDQASGETGAVTQPPASVAPVASPSAVAPPPSVSVTDSLTPEQDAAIRQGLGEAGYQAWKARNSAPVETLEAPAVVVPHPLDGHEIGQPLPPRTDGLSVNMDALRELYALDPKGAADIQKLVYDSNKQQLEAAQARGEAMAVAATSLRALPMGQRQAEFQRNWAPYLIERGYDPAMLRQADLSDGGLDRYYRQGRSIEKIVASAENERDFRLRQENQATDNARADRADARAARGETRAERADARAAVRFKERGLDRAALAASGGVRTDTSDLDY